MCHSPSKQPFKTSSWFLSTECVVLSQQTSCLDRCFERHVSCTCYVKAGQRFKKCACGRTLVMFTWYIVESPLKLTRVLDLHLILQGRYFDQTQGGKHLNSWCHLTTYAQSIASDGWWESSAADRDLLKRFGIFAEAHIPASNSYHTNTDVAAEPDYDHSAQRCSWRQYDLLW